MNIGYQIIWLFIISIPVACISYTVTHEEIFKEPRDFFIKQSKEGKSWVKKKFFYVFTCEYCFSHYVTVIFLIITRFKIIFDDWRGYLISGFSIVWIANQYMSLYNHIRLDIKKDRIDIKAEEKDLNV